MWKFESFILPHKYKTSWKKTYPPRSCGNLSMDSTPKISTPKINCIKITKNSSIKQVKTRTKYQTYICILQRFISKFYIVSSTWANIRHFKLEFPTTIGEPRAEQPNHNNIYIVNYLLPSNKSSLAKVGGINYATGVCWPIKTHYYTAHTQHYVTL